MRRQTEAPRSHDEVPYSSFDTVSSATNHVAIEGDLQRSIDKYVRKREETDNHSARHCRYSDTLRHASTPAVVCYNSDASATGLTCKVLLPALLWRIRKTTPLPAQYEVSPSNKSASLGQCLSLTSVNDARIGISSGGGSDLQLSSSADTESRIASSDLDVPPDACTFDNVDRSRLMMFFD